MYDLNAKTYILKLKKDQERTMVLIESGIRFHTVPARKDMNKIPSGFSMKLRKHIKGKKIEDIKQVGVERVILIQFGLGTNCFYLICEFYAGGNIILTDSTFKILQLIRTHAFTEDAKTAMYQVYPFEQAASMSLEKFDISPENIKATFEELGADAKGGSKKLREVLFKLLPCCHNSLIDSFVKKHELNPNAKALGIDQTKIQTVELQKVPLYFLGFIEARADLQRTQSSLYGERETPKGIPDSKTRRRVFSCKQRPIRREKRSRSGRD